jgi:hypothetical protein
MATAGGGQCCFNPNCPAGVVVYSARGWAVHLQHSQVCQRFVTSANVDPTNARKVAFEARLDLSGKYANAMAWTTATNVGRPPRRQLVNPADGWDMLPDADADNGENTLPGDNDSCATSPLLDPTDPRATFYHAQAAAKAGASPVEEADDVCPTIPPVHAAGLQHADPFAWEESIDKTTAVTLEQRCMVGLLKLLEDMNCPDYALASVVDWAHAAYRDGFDFAPTAKSRDGVLAGLYRHVHNSTLLLPSVVPVDLIGPNVPVDMIVYDFAAQYLSLLHSKTLMRRGKVNIDPQNPFAPYVPPDGLLGEVHSGAMYLAMHRKYITQPHKQLLCPPMFYFDKCHITNGSSRFGLEPATMTSSLFTEVTRRHSDAHRVLGFIHQVLKSSAENSKQDTNANVQNYHRQLAVLFRGLRQVQQGLDKRLQGVEITIYDDVEGDVTFTADIIVPINLFIADTPAANMLCGHYDNHHPSVQRHHHMCDAGFTDLADWANVCTFADATTIFNVQATGRTCEQKAHSVKAVDNAFVGLHILLESSSIFRATTTETMHSIRLGLLTRANGLLFKCLTVDQKAELDIMARRFNEAHRQSVRTSFPRALFVKGITTLSQLSVGERVGVTMTLVCVMQQNDDWTLMSEALKDRDLDAANVLQFLECVSVMPLQRHVLIHPFKCSCQWCKNVCLVCKAMD